MKHKENCECYMCKHGAQAAKIFHAKGMKDYGFYIHYVPDSDDCPNGVNIHTHGIAESFNHLDIQICIALPQNVAVGIMHEIVNLIKEGKSFVPGKKYSQIAEGYNVEFIPAREGERDVLRLMVPNEKGTYSGKMFQLQFTMTGK